MKSVEGFTDGGYSDDEAMTYSTLCFFAGLIITALLNGVVHLICSWNQPSPGLGLNRRANGKDSIKETEMRVRDNNKEDLEAAEGGRKEDELRGSTDAIENIMESDHHGFHLQRVGLMSGLAIGLHNFPEGLATFVGTLADPTAGLAIAVAIALHNIPEGIVVAMPVYYSTKSRFKGFFWAFISGVSEPIGALFGWLILSNLGDLAYAIMFAVVAGMMVYISVRELIPTALKFDVDDEVVTISVFVGMAVMAASLLLFKI